MAESLIKRMSNLQVTDEKNVYVGSVTAGTNVTLGTISSFLPSGASFVGILTMGAGGANYNDDAQVIKVYNNLVVIPRYTQLQFSVIFKLIYQL